MNRKTRVSICYDFAGLTRLTHLTSIGAWSFDCQSRVNPRLPVSACSCCDCDHNLWTDATVYNKHRLIIGLQQQRPNCSATKVSGSYTRLIGCWTMSHSFENESSKLAAERSGACSGNRKECMTSRSLAG